MDKNNKLANDITMAILALRGGQTEQHRQPVVDADLQQAASGLNSIPDTKQLINRNDFIKALSANSPHMIRKSLGSDTPPDQIEPLVQQYGNLQQSLQSDPEAFGAFTKVMDDPRLLQLLREGSYNRIPAAPQIENETRVIQQEALKRFRNK